MSPRQNRHHRDDHGGALADHKPHHGEADGGCKPVFLADKINHIDAPHPADLFRKLGKGGDAGFADAVEIAIDAGVHAGHGDGERDDAQKRGSPRFQQQVCRNRLRIDIDAGCTADGERHRQNEARPECAEGTFVIAGARFTCHILGDGGLDAGHGEGKGQRQHGGDELVEAHALRTEYIGEKNTVKKADKAAD